MRREQNQGWITVRIIGSDHGSGQNAKKKKKEEEEEEIRFYLIIINNGSHSVCYLYKLKRLSITARKEKFGKVIAVKQVLFHSFFFFIITHEAFNIADPSSMQDACLI